MQELVTRIIAAVGNYSRDQCPFMAASVAYYGLFSMFPLLLLLIATAGFLIPDSDLNERLLALAESYLPASVQLLAANIEHLEKIKGQIGIIGALGLYWSASGVFLAVTNALNLIWGAPAPRPYLLRRLMALVIILFLIALFLASIAATALIRTLLTLDIAEGAVISLTSTPLWWFLNNLLPIATVFILFGLAYRYLPNTPIEWNDSMLGSAGATIAFEVLRRLFSWAIYHLGAFNLFYGPVAAVLILLLWIYSLASVLLFGGELAAWPYRKP